MSIYRARYRIISLMRKAVNSRLSVRRLKKQGFFHDCCCEHTVEQTVDDAWQIIDAGDQELQTQALSSQRDFGARS